MEIKFEFDKNKFEKDWKRSTQKLLEDAKKKAIHKGVMDQIQGLRAKGNRPTRILVSHSLPSFRSGEIGGIPLTKSSSVQRDMVMVKFLQQNGETDELSIQIDIR